VYWRLRPEGQSTPFLERDTVEIEVEKMVWPSNETDAADKDDATNWVSGNAEDWNGFTLTPGWCIDKSLSQIINGQSSTIRTAYPEHTKTVTPNEGDPYEVWEGDNDVEDATLDISLALGLEENQYAEDYRIVADFSFEDGPHSQAHYVDIVGERVKPGFFCNSGVKFEGEQEAQIFDTASLNGAFSGTTVTIDGKDATVTATMVNSDGENSPGPLDHVDLSDGTNHEKEQVSALITGILYDEKWALDNWSDEGGDWVAFDSQSDLFVRTATMTIDVFRDIDANGNYDYVDFKIAANEGGEQVAYYYENVGASGNNIKLQSHVSSGVRFSSVTVNAI
ncbi:MAG: hypothetical protein ACOC7K_01785, partial [bacterium]